MKKAHDNGKDSLLKKQYELNGKILYSQALPGSQTALVEIGIQNEVISPNSFKNPVRTVLSSAIPVALDPPTDHVTKLLSSFQVFMACKRKPNNNLSMFVSCFRGVVAKLFVRTRPHRLLKRDRLLLSHC